MEREEGLISSGLKLNILRRYDGLSKAERKVADTVLLQGDRLLDYTIADLARESGVSEPTVVRFCNSLDLRGIKELKKAAVPVLAPKANPVDCLSLDQVNSDEELVSFVLDNVRRILQETHKLLDRSGLDQAIELLVKTRYVKVVGLGGSSVVGRHAQHYLRMVGMHVTLFSAYEPHDTLLEHYNPGDVVLAISYSGNNPVVVDIVEDAKKKGASIISITSWGDNKLQQLSDVALQAPFGGKGIINGYHAIERTAELALVDMLFAGVYLRKKKT